MKLFICTVTRTCTPDHFISGTDIETKFTVSESEIINFSINYKIIIFRKRTGLNLLITVLGCKYIWQEKLMMQSFNTLHFHY